MKWEDKVKNFGKPEYGDIYLCDLQHFDSKNIRKVILRAVKADDHLWVDLDNDEIDEWNWDVISWTRLEVFVKDIEKLRNMDLADPRLVEHLKEKGYLK